MQFERKPPRPASDATFGQKRAFSGGTLISLCRTSSRFLPLPNTPQRYKSWRGARRGSGVGASERGSMGEYVETTLSIHSDSHSRALALARTCTLAADAATLLLHSHRRCERTVMS